MLTHQSAFAQGSFVEMAQQAGIVHFQESPMHLGGGVAVFDLNNDGWDDIYLTGGLSRDRLYRNNTDGTFNEIGVAAGIGITAAMTTHGVVTGDIDNDGHRDILVLTELGEENLLFRNNGNGTFTRVVGVFNIPTTQRSLSATFGDVNNDGLLDIYITNYVEHTSVIFGEGNVVEGFAHDCHLDLLFINNGNLTFTESGSLFGIDQQGCGLAAAFSDFNDDGLIDLWVVNDFGEWVLPNALYQNIGPNGWMADVSEQLHVASTMYGMGIAIADYDRDGDLDYYITNIGPNFLYRNDGGLFTEIGQYAGVDNDSIDGLNTTSWGCFFFDYDNDTWPDLFVANGEIPAAAFIANVFDDPDRLFRNNGDGTFTDVSETVGIGSIERGRGTAYGDFNNDGMLDVVVNHVTADNTGAQAKLYVNHTVNDNHWLKVKVVGTHSNKDGFGSKVRAYFNGVTLLSEIDGGSSHASQNTSVVHFGLGIIHIVDSVVVTFPSGQQQVLTNVTADQMLLIQEDVVTSASEETLEVQRSDVGVFHISGVGDQQVNVEVFDVLGRLLHTASTTSGLYLLPQSLRGIMLIRFSSSGCLKCIRIVAP